MGSMQTAGTYLASYYMYIYTYVCPSTFYIIQFCGYTNCYHEVLEVLEELFLSTTQSAGIICLSIYMYVCLSIYIPYYSVL